LKNNEPEENIKKLLLENKGEIKPIYREILIYLVYLNKRIDFYPIILEFVEGKHFIIFSPDFQFIF